VKLSPVALLLFTLATAAPALAEPSAADLESARALFKEANSLRDAGQHQAALEKYRAANALGRTPITGLELGRAYVTLGQLVEARDVLLAVDRLPVKAGESDKATEARRAATELARDLGERIPSVTIQIVGAQPGVAVTLLVDNVIVPPEAHSLPRKLNPGSHTVEAQVGGAPGKPVPFQLAERDAKQVTVTVEASQSAAPPPPVAAAVAPVAVAPVAAPPPPPPEDPAARAAREQAAEQKRKNDELSSERTMYLGLGYTAVGLGVVGLVIGAVAAGNAMGAADTLDKECVDGRCPASSQGTLDSGESSATLAGIGMLSGLVFSGVGVVLIVKGYGIDVPAQQTGSGSSVFFAVNRAF